MSLASSLRWLYAVNFVLVTCHEIDSAYWREWQLMGIPGGSQLFVLVHVPLLLFVLVGYGQALAGSRVSLAYGALLGVVAVGCFGIHATYLALGHTEFTAPISLALLGTLLVTGLVELAAVAMAWRRGFGGRTDRATGWQATRT